MLKKNWPKEKIFVFGFLTLVLMVYSMVITVTLTRQIKNDFSLFHHATANFFQHQRLYSPLPEEIASTIQLEKLLHQQPNIPTYGSNLTPPAFILYTLPYGLLDESRSLILWDIFSVLISGISVYILYRIFFHTYHQPIIYWALLGIYLASMPSIASISLGQYGPLILLALLGIWQWSKKEYDIRAGIVLGLLLSVKYFFGLFAIFFLLQKRWRLLTASVVTFSTANALAYLVFGKTAFVQYQQNLAHVLWYVNNWNASIFGFLSRFNAHVYHLQFSTTRWIMLTYYGLSAILFLIQIQLCRKPLQNKQDFDFVFCYVLIASILISPLGWLYYLGIMSIPILLIMQALVHAKQKISYWPILIFFSMVMLLNCPVLMRDHIHKGWHNFSFFSANSFYSLVLLLGLLFYCQRKRLFAATTQSSADLIPWATIGYVSSSFSLLFMLFTALCGRLR